uniref:G-protein coupled receptors family 1 profile domain-containing protein n=2 Tax=Biomphalaria TaxID=6525 RepID=A0A2C9KMD9_BIOGL
MSNSCYNPFIYGLLNEKFKREFRQLFAQFPCWKASSDHYTEYFSEDANIFRRANGNCSANRYDAWQTRSCAIQLLPRRQESLRQTMPSTSRRD